MKRYGHTTHEIIRMRMYLLQYLHRYPYGYLYSCPVLCTCLYVCAQVSVKVSRSLCTCTCTCTSVGITTSDHCYHCMCPPSALRTRARAVARDLACAWAARRPGSEAGSPAPCAEGRGDRLRGPDRQDVRDGRSAPEPAGRDRVPETAGARAGPASSRIVAQHTSLEVLRTTHAA